MDWRVHKGTRRDEKRDHLSRLWLAARLTTLECKLLGLLNSKVKAQRARARSASESRPQTFTVGQVQTTVVAASSRIAVGLDCAARPPRGSPHVAGPWR
jgi:hypothetical protein